MTCHFCRKILYNGDTCTASFILNIKILLDQLFLCSNNKKSVRKIYGGKNKKEFVYLYSNLDVDIKYTLAQTVKCTVIFENDLRKVKSNGVISIPKAEPIVSE